MSVNLIVPGIETEDVTPLVIHSSFLDGAGVGDCAHHRLTSGQNRPFINLAGYNVSRGGEL